MQFNKLKVDMPGFKYPFVFVQELSIKQVNEIQKKKFESDVDAFLGSLALCMINEAGDLIVTNDYTIDDFASDVPQSYVSRLADAFTALNSSDDEKDIETAKKS